MTRFAVRLLTSMAVGWAVAFAPPAEGAAQTTGQLAGRVTSADTRAGLTGARVTVRGTSLEAVAGENGRFLFPRVPAGTHTLVATYIGRAPATSEVTVAAGRTQEVEIILGAVQLQALVIEGARAQGQAAALTRQQNAPNISSIVAADQMGRFPDASAPEAVQRLPGVALQRDMGEGRYIGIRGGSAANTQVTVNGEQMPSPEGAVRQVALDAVPVGVLESIEVAKAITPDMDAEAIGGSVNLVTKKAPDIPVLSIEGAGGYASIREGYSGNGALTWGQRSPTGKFGYLFSGSYSRRDFGADDLEPEYDLGDIGLADDALNSLEVRYYSLWRARFGGTASLDYRLSPGSTLFLNGLYSELQDEEQRRRLIHGIEDEELVFRHKNRLEKLRTLNIGAGGDHTLRSGIGVDYRFTMTRSEEDTPYDNEITFEQGDVAFAPSLGDPERPQPNPAAGSIAGPFEFDELAAGISNTRNGDYVGALNLSFPFQFGARDAGLFKVGVKYRDKKKEQTVTETAYELNDDADDLVLGEHVGGPFSTLGYNPGAYPLPPASTSPGDVASFPNRFRSSLDEELDLEQETNDYTIRERTAAAYAMAEINFTPSFMLLPGVRFEHTRFTSEGFEFDDEAEELIARTGENSYGRLFPMIHARYRIRPQTNIRAAFTSAIARPSFVDLVPYIVRDGEDRAVGNPDLKPTTSRNYDLLFEHYDRRIGVMSAGVFYKQLVDPIFFFIRENDEGGVTTRPENSASGRIYGVEAAFQQQLRFLPAPFDGLGVYGNYTYTSSRAEQADGLETRLPGQAAHAYNAALSYEKRRFSGQVSLNYTGTSLDELGGSTRTNGEREEDIFVDSRLQLDVSASFFVLPSTQLFLEATNLTNAPYRTYVGRSVRLRQLEYYEPALQLGLRFRP